MSDATDKRRAERKSRLMRMAGNIAGPLAALAREVELGTTAYRTESAPPEWVARWSVAIALQLEGRIDQVMDRGTEPDHVDRRGGA